MNKSDRVPDAICDGGRGDKEPTIWLTGASAIEVAVKAGKLAKLL